MRWRINSITFQHLDAIIIEVSDNGCGIAKEHIAHIFDPFYTTKSESRGTGLGLSICYGILQNLNGKMKCESDVGAGTKMIVSLPAFQEKSEQIKDTTL
jgi:two-component system, NtrC family, sensor kinase